MTNLIAFDSEVTGLLDEGRAFDVVYFNFCKAFHTISHNIILDKKTKYGLGKWIVRWTENWCNTWPQRVAIGSMKSSWRQVNSGMSQGSTLGSIPFNVFIDDLDDGMECTLRKSADDTRIEGVADRPDDDADVRRSLSRLEHWEERNVIKV